MDDPRELFVRHVRGRKGFRADGAYGPHLKSAVLEAMFHVAADYVHHERTVDELGVGSLERRYSFPLAFFETEDPRAWLEANREEDDLGLIVYVFDNMYNMTPGKHRRTLLYLVSILDFDL